MSSPLIPVLVSLAVVLVLAGVLVARWRTRPKRRPVARRALTARRGQPAAATNEQSAGDEEHRLSDTGIQVDELHVAEDELLSTSERHIGDTQPVDRRLLRKHHRRDER